MNVLEFYQHQARVGLSSIPWVATLQEKSLQALNDFGFPTRHDEDWKYTVIDPLVKQAFDKPLVQDMPAMLPLDIPNTDHIMVYNGEILGLDEIRTRLPLGVILMPLFQALKEHEDQFKPYFGQLLKQEHGFHALNMALMHTGIALYVPAGICIKEPLILSHWQDKEQAVHSRHLLILEEGSEVTLCEDYRGAEGCHYFTNTITEIVAAKAAHLTHYKIQREGRASYHIGQVSIHQSEDSRFDSHSLSLGGQLVRSDMDIQLKKQGARCFLNGIYAPTKGQHIDHHTTVHHQVPHCHSEQDYKGILGGHSRAVFNGKVIVAPKAQHSVAKQQNKNILLSGDAEIDTKPQLEIFADDVICTHGATVGQLDEEALFYLETRGIDKKEAHQYLIQAFASNNLSLIPHQNLAQWMGNLLIEQLR